MNNVVIGVNCSGFHSSACVFVDQQLKTAICEERLTRIKRDRSFPVNAIQYCLDSNELRKEDVNDIFIGWNPRFYLHRSDHMLQSAFQNRGQFAYLALNELAGMQEEPLQQVREILNAGEVNWNIHFVDHHKAHLANGYFQSGFQDTDFLIADGFGEFSTGLTGTIKNGEIDEFSSFRTPHSLGLFYSVFTDYMGFQHNGDEWKVMALSALGSPDKWYDEISSLLKIDDLNVEMDLSYFEHFLPFTPQYYSDKLVSLLGPPFEKGEEPDQRGCDIVAAVQKVAEDKVLELLTNLQRRTGSDSVVLGGGFFMNSVLNGKILDKTPYKHVYIGGSPDDSGVSIGSGYYGINYILEQETSKETTVTNYLGRAYPERDIEEELHKRKLRFQKVSDVKRYTAEQLADDKIIGWFQGRSEFGQRALGNRSILASPLKPEMKDWVNAGIKFREGFRPFAPAVPEEYQQEIFANVDGQNSFFMEKVFLIHREYQSHIPAVTHYDGTGRLQTVKKELNPLFYSLITSFYEITGVPVLLNTSFNINGMPLVESPADAIDCFYQSGIDVLVMHNFVIEK